jgi:tRNA(fMet)-specific endonuclease VapC
VIALDRQLVLDTWVLVHLCRDRTVGQAITHKYRLRERPLTPVISVVTVGEMYSFARRRDWGERKRAQLADIIRNLVIVDINLPQVLDGYAEISTWLRERGRHMGHNDRWIAATAWMLDAVVLTGDTDFDPLHPELVTREWIDERSLESDAPRADEAP